MTEDGGLHQRTVGRRFTRPHFCWLAIAVAPLVVQVSLLQDWFTGSETRLESPIGLFSLVLVAASLCIVTSVLVLRRAVSTSTPELIPLGLFFLAVSALPLAHGVTTPGVLYNDNTATMGTAFWAIPVGVLAAAPNLVSHSWRQTLLARYSDLWLRFWVLAIAAIAVTSMALPNLSPVFVPGRPFEVITIALAMAATLALSYRHIRLAQIARSLEPLVVAGGYAFVAATGAIWFGVEVWSFGFWAAHLLDIGGVFAGTIGALVVYRKTDNVRDALDPILVAHPLSALELGLEPVVHAYVADLEAKDTITRDHVVRTSELSLLVGEELGYDGDTLRHISLVGLLHDVGKLDVPDDVLKKPGKLTDEEFEIIKSHPIDGAERAAQSVVLAPLAPGIRGHHERIDGRGYPDQLSGDEIPIESRIVAACDAFDAMAMTRQYRSGMGTEKAIAILREHQGSQWDSDVVDALVRVLEREPRATLVPALDSVGRADEVTRVGCDCLPEVHMNELAEKAPTKLTAS